MKNRTWMTRAVLPRATLAALAALAALAVLTGCAQTGGTHGEAAADCQGLRLAQQPPQAGCIMRSSLARLASGRPLYTVLEAPLPHPQLRLVRIDSDLVRLEFSTNMQASAPQPQGVSAPARQSLAAASP